MTVTVGSQWQQFLELLRQIGSLKKTGATGVALDALVEEAWDLWPELPPPVPGKPRMFPADTIAIARELGFARSSNRTEEIDPRAIEDEAPVRATPPPPPMAMLQANFDDAADLQTLARTIDKAITEAGGIGNVSVACSPQRVVLKGIAADDDARDDAQIITAKLAPGLEIVNSITVA